MYLKCNRYLWSCGNLPIFLLDKALSDAAMERWLHAQDKYPNIYRGGRDDDDDACSSNHVECVV